jgi:phage baseplate assembly protein W
MPRNTRVFVDLDLNFTKNPVTGDVSKKYDENAIKQSVKNLIMTNHYERLFHPEVGSQVSGLLFEPASPLLDAMLTQAIKNTITNFEPRVNLIRVDVRSNPDNYTLYVSITFKIINTERPLSINFTLQRTR